MTRHILKSWPEFFEPIRSGMRSFDLRQDDRHYHAGDTVVLREWEPCRGDAATSDQFRSTIGSWTFNRARCPDEAET